MRVTSEPLRRNWERAMNNGQKLEDVISSREQENRKWKARERNSYASLLVLSSLLILVSSVVIHMIGDQWCGWTLKFSLIVAANVLTFLAVIWNVFFWPARYDKIRHKIDECEKILVTFQASVDALNPLGIGNTYHDVLTAAVVIDRIVDLAYKVVDAEDRFERLLQPGAIRFDIVHGGQWIEKCNAWFERIWTSATVDFALELNKREIFARAVHRFSKREKRQPAHLAK